MTAVIVTCPVSALSKPGNPFTCQKSPVFFWFYFLMFESHVYYREFLYLRLGEKPLWVIGVIVGLLLIPARALRCEMVLGGLPVGSQCRQWAIPWRVHSSLFSLEQALFQVWLAINSQTKYLILDRVCIFSTLRYGPWLRFSCIHGTWSPCRNQVNEILMEGMTTKCPLYGWDLSAKQPQGWVYWSTGTAWRIGLGLYLMSIVQTFWWRRLCY